MDDRIQKILAKNFDEMTSEEKIEIRKESQRQVDKLNGITPGERFLGDTSEKLLEASKDNRYADTKHQEEVKELMQKIEAAMPGHKQIEGLGMMLSFSLVLLFLITLLLGATLWRLW